MSDKPEPQPKGNVTVSGHMIGSAIGEGNMIETGDITIYEKSLKQSGALSPELVKALTEALKGIQESGLPPRVKDEAVKEHANLTEELKKPEEQREPTLVKKFWNGLWSVAEKIPTVVKLSEALKKYVPSFG